MQRPKTLLLLLIIFCWVDAKAFGAILFPSTSGSYHLTVALGRPWIHYALSVVTVALAGLATQYLWRPRRGWFRVSLIALGFFVLSGLATVWYTVAHIDVARDAYATGRAERGLPLSPERLEQLFSPDILWAGALVTTAGYLLLVWMAWRRRGYTSAVVGVESDPSLDSLP